MGIPVTRLELIITERCNSQCRHCCFRTSANGPDMSAHDAERWVKEAAAASLLTSVLVFGGEPMLNPQATLAAIRVAAACDVTSVDMITNGSWADTDESARRWAHALAQAGLMRLVLSVDTFHTEFVPVECLRRAAIAAKEAGIPRLAWNVSVLRRGAPKLAQDIMTWKIVDGLRDLSEEINENEVLPSGRALKNYSHLYQRRVGIPAGVCPSPSYGTGLVAPSVLTMRPNGDAEICWELPIGNAKQQSLSSIITRCEPFSDPTIRKLITNGPAGLLELPEATGYRPKRTYVDTCELCQEVRRWMRNSRKEKHHLERDS